MLRVSICWNLKVKVYIYTHKKKRTWGREKNYAWELNHVKRMLKVY